MYSILTGPSCRWCVRTKMLLEDKGLPYVAYDLSEPENKMRKEMFLLSGYKTVPQIYGPDKGHIGGYEDLVKHLDLT